MQPQITNDDIADVWVAVAAARLERDDLNGATNAFRTARIVREGVRQADGLREHNRLALRKSGYGS